MRVNNHSPFLNLGKTLAHNNYSGIGPCLPEISFNQRSNRKYSFDQSNTSPQRQRYQKPTRAEHSKDVLDLLDEFAIGQSPTPNKISPARVRYYDLELNVYQEQLNQQKAIISLIQSPILQREPSKHQFKIRQGYKFVRQELRNIGEKIDQLYSSRHPIASQETYDQLSPNNEQPFVWPVVNDDDTKVEQWVKVPAPKLQSRQTRYSRASTFRQQNPQTTTGKNNWSFVGEESVPAELEKIPSVIPPPEPQPLLRKSLFSKEKIHQLMRLFRVRVRVVEFCVKLPLYVTSSTVKAIKRFTGEQSSMENQLLNEINAWMSKCQSLFNSRAKIEMWKEDFAVIDNAAYGTHNSDSKLATAMRLVVLATEVLLESINMITEKHIWYIMLFSTPGGYFLENFFTEFVTTRMTPNRYNKLSRNTTKQQTEMIAVEYLFLQSFVGRFVIMNSWFRAIEKIERGLFKLKLICSFLQDLYFEHFGNIAVLQSPSQFQHNTSTIKTQFDSKLWRDKPTIIRTDEVNHTQDKIFIGLYSHEQLYSKVSTESKTMSLKQVAMKNFQDWISQVSNRIADQYKKHRVTQCQVLANDLKTVYRGQDIDSWVQKSKQRLM